MGLANQKRKGHTPDGFFDDITHEWMGQTCRLHSSQNSEDLTSYEELATVQTTTTESHVSTCLQSCP